PSAVWLSPIDLNLDTRTISACSCQTVIFGITTTFGLYPDSTIVWINGIEYLYDPSWMFFSADHDSLIIDPAGIGCWSHGETVVVQLHDLVDSTGGHLVSPVTDSFLVDLEGPDFTGITPTGVVSSDSIVAYVYPVDDFCLDILPDSMVAYIGGSGIASSYGSTDLDITALSDSDSVTVCAFAHDDCADYCGSNYSDTCWSFTVALGTVTAIYIYPDDADGDGTIVTACECTEIRWLISSSYDIVPESTLVEVDGIIYDWPSGLLEFRDDTLIWNPADSICFTDSALVGFELVEVIDITGGYLAETVGDTFLVDLSSPVLYGSWPYPYSYELDPDFGFALIDSVYDVNHSDFIVIIGSDSFDMASGYTSWSDDTLLADYSSFPESFNWGDMITVSIAAYDIVDHCEPHSINTSWEVVIADTVAPEAALIEPFDGAVSACIDQQVVWHLADTMIGIDTARVWISLDGTPISLSSAELYYSSVDSILTYSPLTWVEGSHTACLDSAYDIFGNPLSGVPICVNFYIDLSPPEIVFIEPPCSTVVHDTLAEIIFTITDYPAGVWWDSLLFVLETDTFYVDDLDIGGDTATFDPAAHGVIWHDGDTISYCVSDADSADYCTGENDTTLCCEFYVEISELWAELLEPPLDIITSCSLQSVSWLFHGSVTDDNIVITVDDTGIYTAESTEVWFLDDSLAFTPDHSWLNGDTLTICLVDATDSFGVHLADTVCAHFIIDLDPPLFGDFVPPIGGIVSEISPLISVRVWDLIAGVDPDSTWMTINGTLCEPVSHGDTLVFDPADSLWEWTGGDTITVCVGAADLAQICGANADSICWFFVIAPGEPLITPIFPPDDSLWSACFDQGAIFTVIDSDGIDISSIIVTVDGDTTTDWVFADDTLIYTPSTGFSDGDSVTVCVWAEDVLGNPPADWSCITYFIDLEPPVFWGINPPSGSTISTSLNMNVCLADSGSGIDESSIVLTVNTISYDTSDIEITWDGEFLRILLMAGSFAPGETVTICLDSILDSPDLCGPNILDTCWRYYVESPPDIWTDDSLISLSPPEILEGDSLFFKGVGYIDDPLGEHDFDWAITIGTRSDGDTLIYRAPAFVADSVYEHLYLIPGLAEIEPGDYLVCFRLDVGDWVAESDETNNIGCAPLSVLGAGCEVHPNPFSPNGDLVNDVALFNYPGQSQNDAVIKIYD
ncbi:hypothetical protein DRQ36_10910, partial [bacterium]